MVRTPGAQPSRLSRNLGISGRNRVSSLGSISTSWIRGGSISDVSSVYSVYSDTGATISDAPRDNQKGSVQV